MTGKTIVARLVELADVLDQEHLFVEADALTGVAERLALSGDQNYLEQDED